MNQPLISVVIPVYNAQNTLSRCIESILRQTYPYFEIVLVNDGSKDDSLSVCQEYAQKYAYIQVVDVENGGVSRARNLGMVHASGDYVVFVDSDDYVYDDYLEVLFHNYSEDLLPVASYTVIESKEARNVVYGDKKYMVLPMSSFFSVYEAGMMGSPCNKIYDLNFIKEENIYFKRDLSLGEDLLFNLDYIKAKGYQNLSIINKPILYYDHADEGTLSTTFSKEKMLMLSKIYATMIQFMKDYCHNKKHISHMKDKFYYESLFFSSRLYRQEGQENFIKQFIYQNEVSSLKEMLRMSKNRKLKIKLMITYYLGFRWYYKLFVKEK